ncbi:hypothetical protein Syun_029046 [Stephania yunnanensis]|uniref:Uncharacterized protein n=1 Tax=Stephania yunnanensis TaxID=152371 RepID=A0AAP0HJ36_9MAGN
MKTKLQQHHKKFHHKSHGSQSFSYFDNLYHNNHPFWSVAQTVDFSYPAVFNFGDSNSDTGDLVSGLGIRLDLPNGQTYFQKPSARFCDGRLLVDFLMDAMDLPFLNAYLESIGAPSFRTGCNFAAAGSAILPATATSVSPFSFGIQVSQFLRFKARVLELLAKGKKQDKYIPQEDYFTQGLYMFDIGQNDVDGAFYSKSEDQVVASIPNILLEFETGIKRLYDQGARRFWIHNTSPLGCLPKNIARYGQDSTRLDELGCVSSHNRSCKAFQSAALRSLQKIAKPIHGCQRYLRFKQPLMACCGYGGPPTNYDSRISCGQTKDLNGSAVTAKGCDDSSKYISWDGIHYTEAVNHYVSSQILIGNYSDPPLSDKMPLLLKKGHNLRNNNIVSFVTRYDDIQQTDNQHSIKQMVQPEKESHFLDQSASIILFNKIYHAEIPGVQ